MYQTSLLGSFTRLTKTRHITSGLSSSMSAIHALLLLLMSSFGHLFFGINFFLVIFRVLKVDVIKLGLQLYIDPIRYAVITDRHYFTSPCFIFLLLFRSLITDWLKSHKRPLKLTQHTFAVYFGLCDVFCLISPYQRYGSMQTFACVL